MSKPIHPLCLPNETPARTTPNVRSNGYPEFDLTFSQERHISLAMSVVTLIIEMFWAH